MFLVGCTVSNVISLLARRRTTNTHILNTGNTHHNSCHRTFSIHGECCIDGCHPGRARVCLNLRIPKDHAPPKDRVILLSQVPPCQFGFSWFQKAKQPTNLPKRCDTFSVPLTLELVMQGWRLSPRPDKKTYRFLPSGISATNYYSKSIGVVVAS